MTKEQIKRKDVYLKRKYGLSYSDFLSLIEKQEGGCPICLRFFGDGNITPVVDHDHRTNAVRGILCRYCNHRRLGNHRDSSLLRRMADYLDRESTGFVAPVKLKKPRKRRRK